MFAIGLLLNRYPMRRALSLTLSVLHVNACSCQIFTGQIVSVSQFNEIHLHSNSCLSCQDDNNYDTPITSQVTNPHSPFSFTPSTHTRNLPPHTHTISVLIFSFFSFLFLSLNTHMHTHARACARVCVHGIKWMKLEYSTSFFWAVY